LIVRIPTDAMVVLVGPSGSGKSTFASRHFLQTQVLSSDALRAVVADDADDQTATDAAFELLHSALAMRLVRRKLTVVDATSVEGWARQHLLSVARRLGRPAAAIVFNLPLATCLERNVARTDRRRPPAAIRRPQARMRASLDGLSAEGYAALVVLSSPDEADAVVVEPVSA
jgi:protein phosphatase